MPRGATAAVVLPTASSPHAAWWFSCYALAWGSWATLFAGAGRVSMAALTKRTFQPAEPEPLAMQHCPASCGDLFGKLGVASRGGSQMTQRVQVQERGEPKSGTGFMFEWATNALAHSCMYLQQAYGEKSCWIEWNALNRTMVFDPSLSAAAPGPCPCEDVGMVVTTLMNLYKHKLPVQDSCSFSHPKGVPGPRGKVCTPRSGRRPQNQKELQECVRESACPIVDNRLQMSVFRDPRPVAVSVYFHSLRVRPGAFVEDSVDKYALELLPVVCQWISVRYLLFTEMLGQKSSVFWYDDAQQNPGEWHNQFYDFVGLRMPASVIANSTAIATGQALDDRLSSFPLKGKDVHRGIGGNSGSHPPARKLNFKDDIRERKLDFRDEIHSATLSKMDEVLRIWLPPVLLERFGVR